MKTVAVVLALVASASAFAPASKVCIIIIVALLFVMSCYFAKWLVCEGMI